jgi:hypothetical protein
VTAVVPAGPEGTVPSCRDVVAELYRAGQPVILPVFTSRTAPGASSTYTLAGLAGFLLCGYAFEGTGIVTSCPDECSGPQNLYRICGRYVPITLEDGQWGAGDDFGVRVVRGIG